MVELTEDECLAISRSPLEIAHLRGPLQAAIENDCTDSQQTHPLPSDDDRDSDSTEVDEESDAKDAISVLLVALQTHRVAKKLRSRESRGSLDRELALMYSRVDGITFAAFFPLIQAVLRKASDIEIWKQVLLLITSSARITPPPSVSASFGGTPRTHNSASHQGSEQTKRLLHDALRDELHDCSYVKVPGFFEKYFDNKSWTQKSKDVFDAVKHTHSDGRWTTFPSTPTESAVWEWWSQLQNKHLTHVRGAYYTTKSKNDIVDTDGERQLDLFVKSRDATTRDRHDWADVRVVGEHTVSQEGGKKFLQLARYARNIFSAQPRRQFVHGFILSHTKMELHVFDRSGTFSQEPFDIHKDPDRFIRVISAYCMMSDEELGLDTFIERDGKKEFLTVVDGDAGKDKRLQLDPKPIARQAAVVGRGTSCYPIQDREGVVKFSWVSASKSPTEPDLLKLANERSVKGVPRLVGYRRAISTSEMRSPLVFSKKRHMEGRQWCSHRRQSQASFSSQLASLPLSDEGKKRKSTGPDESSSKKPRSNSQTSKLSQVYEASKSFHESPQASHTAIEPFVDRVLCMQATQPAGTPLAEYRSVSHFLRVLRDALKSHRSLLQDGKILHRDVSKSNIVITDPNENEGYSGMLIDLELGTTIEDGKNTRTGSKRMTGTLKYMAIEVVELALRDNQRDLEHTYRHDLESFFYVLVDMCINYGWPEGQKPKRDSLRSWYLGDYQDIVTAKTGNMERGRFKKDILRQFSKLFENVRELAMSLRDLLFLRGDELRTGTPAEAPSILYDRMIAAFDEAIKSCDN
ncbi:hypothetical protein LTR09_012970 [Extremus antarcticus]|uniref:EKC/KEOPS complex subunit BUD32 n=1 Tax=Extremus antarcticus TaxID=702011 RepID=A0AAJ0D4C4_9PEZI|nr:hypothetical protein LTR09_012970 [Extremus antarcticus]